MILIIQEKFRRDNMVLEKYHLNFLRDCISDNIDWTIFNLQGTHSPTNMRVRDDIKIVKDDNYYHLRTEYRFMKHTDLFMFDFKLSKGKNFSELEYNILQLAETISKLKAFL